MSKLGAQEFLQRMRKDESFRKRIQEASEEDRDRIIKEEGYEFTKDKLDEACSELDDAQLEEVSAAGEPLHCWSGGPVFV